MVDDFRSVVMNVVVAAAVPVVVLVVTVSLVVVAAAAVEAVCSVCVVVWAFDVGADSVVAWEEKYTRVALDGVFLFGVVVTVKDMSVEAIVNAVVPVVLGCVVSVKGSVCLVEYVEGAL